MRNLYIGIAVVLLLAAGVFLFVQNKGGKTQTNSVSGTSTSTTDNSTPASDSATITYSDSGFSPNSVTIKSGGKLTVTNSSSSNVQFDSDPHPIHTDNNELNIGTINAGDSKTTTPNKTGTWGYHNHLDSSQKGTIIVK